LVETRGNAEMLAWLFHDRDIEPHIPVFDKSDRADGTFSRGDFAYDVQQDTYTCPDGNSSSGGSAVTTIARTRCRQTASIVIEPARPTATAAH
jgi:hypothetical protein